MTIVTPEIIINTVQVDSESIVVAKEIAVNVVTVGIQGVDGAAVAALNEGTTITTNATSFNFVGAGVNATAAGNNVTVTVSDAILRSEYTPSHSILVQQSGTGSPTALQIGNNTLVGRLSGGGSLIDDLSATDVRTLLNVANGATSYTDEMAQDAVGGMLLNTNDITLAYSDATPSLSASLLSTAITAKTEVTAEAGFDYMLISDASDSGNLKKALIPAGGGGGSQEVFVQDTEPAPVGQALWVQTGLGVDGNDLTLWAIY